MFEQHSLWPYMKNVMRINLRTHMANNKSVMLFELATTLPSPSEMSFQISLPNGHPKGAVQYVVI